MVRYACAAVAIAGLTGCFREEVPVPEPVHIPQECPTLADQIPPELYAPVRVLGRGEVVARGGRNRDLYLVFKEQEEELQYCQVRAQRLKELIDKDRSE